AVGNVHRPCTTAHTQKANFCISSQFTACTNVHFVHICTNPFRGDVSNKIRCKAPPNDSRVSRRNLELNRRPWCIGLFIGSALSESHSSIDTRDTSLL